MYLFILSQENQELACKEVEHLMHSRPIDEFEHLIVMDNCHDDLIKRLAYTKRVVNILFESDVENVRNDILEFEWRSIITGSYCVRTFTLRPMDFSEKELGSIIWQKLTNPVVDVKNPDCEVNVVFADKVYVGIKNWVNKEDFEARKAHKRAHLKPVSMHPKLARAAVNLVGAKKGSTIVDPFVGTGGILMEAGLMDLKCIGWDISDEMLDICRAHMNDLGIHAELENKNALELDDVEYVVTDPPYAKNTDDVDVVQLYTDFIKLLADKLQKRAVIIFPAEIDYKKIIGDSLKIRDMVKQYIHQSMTKRVVLLSNKLKH